MNPPKVRIRDIGLQDYEPVYQQMLDFTDSRDENTPDEVWLDEMSLAEAKQYLAEGTHFAAGSMAPKIEAVIRFLEAGGEWAIITNPENLERALAGETGTHIRA